ncbi:hypothetical protein BRE01_60130 [Brevibacillus reuszeri]|uniref:Peptidyl-prolyl cis-trans isomerase n=1 Tax=Brevibacillus reuszeri TaxID=54915 RepID=A0ABQ0TWW0_9BACL|nr:peptidylprolyl isomerase [Brevibacillus reuszeri]MED1859194.1 peptidylprolyl isomerase [Brevibacillus reuszeri]GED72311.1 hypothetical protein BRE01_60130 [Brevibacillus reuszeri]
MKRTLLAVSSILLSISLLVGCSNSTAPTSPESPEAQPTQPQKPADTTPAQPPGPTGAKKYDKAPTMQIDKAKTYQAKISTTMGDITVDLFAKDAPIAVNNFVFLAKDKFYDGVTFHRVIKDFMIQTGDPLGSGKEGKTRQPSSGSSDETIASETVA